MNKHDNKPVSRVGFINFFKLNLLYGLAMGQAGGLICLICATCGIRVSLDLGFWQTEGVGPGSSACSWYLC